MNKKYLLSLLTLAIIPVFVLGLNGPDADTMGKQFAKNNPGVTIGVHSLEEDITEQEEINRATLIIEGTVLNTKPYWKIINDPDFPRIFTDYTIKVSEVIKGDPKKIVKVTLMGGNLDGVSTQTTAPEIVKGDRVIMILGQDLDSLFKGSYVPVSISKSTYIIDEKGNAKNINSDRTGDKGKVKDRLIELTKS